MTLADRQSEKKNEAVGRSLLTARRASAKADALLAWYDRERRDLPWRAGPGEKADPYRVWLSEIMLQQTTVKAVVPYYARFLTRFPTLQHLASAKLEEVLKLWAGLGYYARARNLHACARALLSEHGGKFPDTEDKLRALPGIGAYTAAAISAIAFGRKATPVDGNVERVVARLFAVETPLPAGKSEIASRARALTPARRPGDFAQAMMDLGAVICTPRQPACALCPLRRSCTAHRRGDQDGFPRRAPRKEGALRRGAAFVAMREDGAILIRTRPAKGLLAHMSEVPTTDWTSDFSMGEALSKAPRFCPSPSTPPRGAPASSRKRGEGRKWRRGAPGERPSPIAWRRLPGAVNHAFTHFPLELIVYKIHVPKDTAAPDGARWISRRKLAEEALPNVMRKVVAYALKDERRIEEHHAE